MAGRRVIGSNDLYKLLRQEMGPPLKQRGFRRLRGPSGWYRVEDNDRFELHCDLEGAYWNSYSGASFVCACVMAYEEGQGALRAELSEFLSFEELEELRILQNDVISRISMPRHMKTYRRAMPEVYEYYQREQQPVLEPYRQGELIRLRYLSLDDARRWTEWILSKVDRLEPTLRERWAKERPDPGPATSRIHQSNQSEDFLAEIVANPDDDVPRLIYADWLEEQGDPLGEFIRLQCELASREVEPDQRRTLQRREHELLAQHGKVWGAPATKVSARPTFHRGFIDDVSVTTKQFINHGARLFEQLPLLDRLTLRSLEFDELHECELLSRIRHITIDHRSILRDGTGPEAWSHFLSSPFLDQVIGLDLTGTRLMPSLVACLAQSPIVAQLRELHLAANGFRSMELDPLWYSDLYKLELLNLGNNRLSGSALVNIAQSPQLTNLRSLWLDHNTIGMQGIAALVASPILSQLQELRFQGNRLTDKSASEMLKAQWPPEFRLTLSKGGVSDEVLQQLGERFQVEESL